MKLFLRVYDGKKNDSRIMKGLLVHATHPFSELCESRAFPHTTPVVSLVGFHPHSGDRDSSTAVIAHLVILLVFAIELTA